MNVLFLTLAYPSVGTFNIYTDLLDEFVKAGDSVWVICQSERRTGTPTQCSVENGKTVLRVKTMNITGEVGIVEKGIATITIDRVFIKSIKKHLVGVNFDLILYSTPPITLDRCVRYLKWRNNTHTYLLLKDIFPQNAVDMGMMREGRLLHSYFRCREKQLYYISDFIGCMSQANVDYVLRNNPEIDHSKVHVCPNSIIPKEFERSEVSRAEQRKKYSIPENAVVFMYGGNLGAPQGIPFVVQCLKKMSSHSDCYFIICGSGSEYPVLEQYINAEKPSNVLLINGLPKSEYDALLQACNVGLLFLDHRFTIPNFPSRMLSYMEQSMPILACTDPNTDVGKVIVDGGFGWWCESDSTDGFEKTVREALSADMPSMGERAYRYFMENYTVGATYGIITKQLKEEASPVEV